MRKIFLMFVIIVVCGVIGLSAMQYNGFCVAERRWVGKQEMFLAAMRQVYGAYPPQRFRIPGVYSKKIERFEQYSDFVDFANRNPNCCSKSKTGWKGLDVGFFHRLKGYSGGFIRVEYAADADGLTQKDKAWIASNATKYTGVNDERLSQFNQKNLSFVPMDNCGKIWQGF